MFKMNTQDNFICEYCGKIITNILDHIEKCSSDNSRNYDENGKVLRCYSCGLTDQEYSKSQLSVEKSRCKNCVASNIKEKHKPFAYPAYKGVKNDNTELMENVERIDLEKVRELLEKGANANYHRQDYFYNVIQNRAKYNFDGSEKEENDKKQPCTPLKMCVFRFSDCVIGLEQRREIIKIVELLLSYGGDRMEALEYFWDLYGDKEFEKAEWNDFLNLLKN